MRHHGQDQGNKATRRFNELTHRSSRLVCKIFAAGDCATITGLKDAKSGNERASPPKAGVYAVRSRPLLIKYISRYFLEQEMDEYDPQDDFLKLINCGDGTALGFRFGLPLRGNWVWELKDKIDKMFMELFREDNLPDLSKEDIEREYASAQYDEYTRDSKRPSPEEGCQLILRGDENVDFQHAWGVLREMMFGSFMAVPNPIYSLLSWKSCFG